MGIPARPITTYVSAHDTEANKTIDYYFDKDWNLIEDKSADSIWYALLLHYSIHFTVYICKSSALEHTQTFSCVFHTFLLA